MDVVNRGPSKLDPNAFRHSKESGPGRNRRWLYVLLGAAALIVSIWLTKGYVFAAFSLFDEEKEREQMDIAPAKGDFNIHWERREIEARMPGEVEHGPTQPEPAADLPIDDDDDEPLVPPAALAQPSDIKMHARPEHDLGGDEPKKPFGSITSQVDYGTSSPQEGFVNGVMPDMWRGCAMRPGHVIAANLVHAVDSEVPGDVIAEVRETIYNLDGVRDQSGNLAPLIPAGTRFVGAYKEEKGGGGTKIGDTRLGITWKVATTPAGWRPRNINLSKSKSLAMAGDGKVGIGGEVDTRIGESLLYAAVYTLINWGSSAATPDEEGAGGQLQGAASDEFGGVARRYVEGAIDTSPRIVMKAGTRMLIHFRDVLRMHDRCV